jgi:hypothetical protein
MEPGSHRRLNWEKAQQLVELVIKAIGPVAELIDAVSRILH